MNLNFSKSPLNLTGKKIWIAGHNGMVGSALVRALSIENCQILTASKAELDLRRQADVEAWIIQNEPGMIVIAAAKVGGIGANASAPADFIYDNMMIETNIIHAAYQHNVEKLLFLGTSCIYPKFAEQPIREDALMSGDLEPTNQSYAIAKIAGIQLCQGYRQQYGCNFISAMPCNLYGVGDTYDPERSHVIPAMLMKLHRAKMTQSDAVTFWGTGTPLREFLYVDDLAKGLIHLLKTYNGAQHINIGSGDEISIRDLAHKIADQVGYKGNIQFDTSKPDGTPRKILNNQKIVQSGWLPETDLDEGLQVAYKEYLQRNEIQHAA